MKFNLKSTGMPRYDEMIKDPKYFREQKNIKFDIVMMEPLDYLMKASKILGMEYSRFIDSRLANLEKLEKKNVSMWDMPVLDYTFGNSQEGATRSLMAFKKEIPRIPVMVVQAYDKSQRVWY